MTEIGRILKEARLAKGMSLDDLQSATKIQKRYLVGIEEGNYSMMPGQFYVRAFIKQYAEAVGLHSEELFEQYKAEIPSTINDDIPEKLSRVQSRKNIGTGNSKVFDILPKILIAVFVIGASAILYYFYSQKDNGESTKESVEKNRNEQVSLEESENFTKDKEDDIDENTETDGADDSENKEEEVVPDLNKQELTVVETSGRNTVYELKNTDTFQLKVVSTGETWVDVKNGKGFSFYQGMLKKGGTESQTVDFTNEGEAVIVVGRSTETEIYINDEKVEFAIPPAESVRQEITIRYLKNNE